MRCGAACGQGLRMRFLLSAPSLLGSESEEASSLAQVIEQWTGNPKAAGSIPVGRQFFALLVLSSRRSGGSSLGFRAGSL